MLEGDAQGFSFIHRGLSECNAAHCNSFNNFLNSFISSYGLICAKMSGDSLVAGSSGVGDSAVCSHAGGVCWHKGLQCLGEQGPAKLQGLPNGLQSASSACLPATCQPLQRWSTEPR